MAFTLGIEVTRACNFRCGHCFVDAGKPRASEASTAQLIALLREAAACGVDSLGWSGGEPLMRRDLEALTRYARASGMTVGLATNGYLASAARLEALRAAGLSIVQVSLDGPDATTAARYRQGPRGAFERAVEATRSSVALGLRTYVCCLLAPETLGEVDAMLELARSLGAAGLRYTIWTPVGRARGQRYDAALWPRPALARFLSRVQRLTGSGRGFRVLIDCPTGPLPWHRRYTCHAGRDTAYVTADGDLYPCTALMFPKYKVGNVFARPFAELFCSGAMLLAPQEIAARTAGGACAACRLEPWCRGGCPGRTFTQHGRLHRGATRRPMPLCFYDLCRPAEPPLRTQDQKE